MLFNRLNIALKGEDKGWETFDKLVNQGDLNRDEWENQEVFRFSEQNTGDTDNSQNKGIDSLDEENRSNPADIVNDSAAFKKNLRDIVKVGVKKNQVGNLPSCGVALRHDDGAVCFT